MNGIKKLFITIIILLFFSILLAAFSQAMASEKIYAIIIGGNDGQYWDWQYPLEFYEILTNIYNIPHDDIAFFVYNGAPAGYENIVDNCFGVSS